MHQQTRPHLHRSAFTLVELLVVIGIIALLISILLPSLRKARQASYEVACLSNLRSLGQAMVMYASEHRGLSPQTQIGMDPMWPYQLWRYTSPSPAPGYKSYKAEANWHRTVFNCPSGFDCRVATQDADLGYIYSFNDYLPGSRTNKVIHDNGSGQSARLSRVKRPSEVFLLVEQAEKSFDGRYRWIYKTSSSMSNSWFSLVLTNHHNVGTNALFVDGHAESMPDGEWPRQPSGLYIWEALHPRWTGADR